MLEKLQFECISCGEEVDDDAECDLCGEPICDRCMKKHMDWHKEAECDS